MHNRKIVLVTLTVIILFIAVLAFAGQTYNDLEGLYPVMTWEDAQQYEYTIKDHGIDFYLLEIGGITYLVKL